LLQENGYFVLRFLAEDVGKELDATLDAILRVLARRRHSAARAEPLKFVRPSGE
jgi:very-short-patch-repair endonuclease